MKTFQDTEDDRSPLRALQQGTNKHSHSSKTDANPEDLPGGFPKPVGPAATIPRLSSPPLTQAGLTTTALSPLPLLVPNIAASTNHSAPPAEPSSLLAASRIHHFPTIKIQLPIGPLPQAPPSKSSTTTEAGEQKRSNF